MKTIKENQQVSVVTTKEVEVYITDDGKKFNTIEEAKKHEEALEKVKQINEKYRVKNIDPEEYGINITGCISCKALYIEELNEETIKDLTSMYPYLAYEKRKLEQIKKGWNIIVEEEWDSNGLGRWSGYELYIYHPEEIIEEKRKQIENLQQLIENK